VRVIGGSHCALRTGYCGLPEQVAREECVVGPERCWDHGSVSSAVAHGGAVLGWQAKRSSRSVSGRWSRRAKASFHVADGEMRGDARGYRHGSLVSHADVHVDGAAPEVAQWPALSSPAVPCLDASPHVKATLEWSGEASPACTIISPAPLELLPAPILLPPISLAGALVSASVAFLLPCPCSFWQ